jgi:hypothetical protein
LMFLQVTSASVYIFQSNHPLCSSISSSCA